MPPCMAHHTMIYPASCGGSPETSACTTFIICRAGFHSTGCQRCFATILSLRMLGASAFAIA